MIWYWHWLEIRLQFLIFAALAALLSMGYAGSLSRPVSMAFPTMQAILPPEQYIVWGQYASLIGAFWIFGVALAAGRGFAVSPKLAANRYQSFSAMGLPVSRTNWVLSRFVAGVLQVAAGLAWMLLLTIVAASLRGYEPPWQAMLATTAGIFIGYVPMLAWSTLMFDIHWRIGFALTLLPSLFFFNFRSPLFPSDGGPARMLIESTAAGVYPWLALAVAVALTAALVGASLFRIQRQDL